MVDVKVSDIILSPGLTDHSESSAMLIWWGDFQKIYHKNLMVNQTAIKSLTPVFSSQ